MIARHPAAPTLSPRRPALPRFGRRHRLRRLAPRRRRAPAPAGRGHRLLRLCPPRRSHRRRRRRRQRPVFRAPDLGTTGTVQAARVLAAAATSGIEAHRRPGPRARSPSPAPAAPSASEEMKQAPRPRHRPPERPRRRCRPGRRPSIGAVRAAQIEPGLTGRLQVTQLAWSAGRRAASMRRFGVDGSTILVASAAARLRHGGRDRRGAGLRPRAEPGETCPRRRRRRSIGSPAARPRPDAVASLAAAIGQAVRRNTRPGQPILAGDLTKPESRCRNDAVTLVYEAPGMVLSVRAKALDGRRAGRHHLRAQRAIQPRRAGDGHRRPAA